MFDGIRFDEAMHLNRKERRRLAAINKMGRIPGVNQSYVNPERQAKKKSMLDLEDNGNDKAKGSI